jgi:hypothetical protein
MNGKGGYRKSSPKYATHLLSNNVSDKVINMHQGAIAIYVNRSQMVF